MGNPGQRDEQYLDLAQAIRRRWLQIVAVTVILVDLAAWYGYARPAVYSSSALVALRPVIGNPLSPGANSTGQQVSLAMHSEAAVVDSQPIVEIVSKKLGDKLLSGAAIHTKVVANSEIIAITFNAPSATKARAGAQATAEALIQYRSARAAGAVAGQLRSLRTQEQAAQAQLDRATKSDSHVPQSIEAQGRVGLYSNQVSALQQSIAQFQLTETAAGTVARPANNPKHRNGIAPWLYVVGAGLTGLGVSILVAIWEGRRDRMVRGGMLVTIGPHAVLATLPATPVPFIDDGVDTGALRNAYVHARTAVLVGAPRARVIVVSHVSCGHLDAEVATNLGLSLGAMGAEVAVVDARTDARALPYRYAADARPSLSAVLDAGRLRDVAVARRRGVYVVPADDAPGLADQLAGATFSNLLRDLRFNLDYVLVAAAPVCTAAGLAVALAGDGLILTVMDGVTTRSEARDLLELASGVGVEILGVVVIPRPQRRRRGYKTSTSAPPGAMPDARAVSPDGAVSDGLKPRFAKDSVATRGMER